MRYEEFRPSQPLARFIKCFWALQGPAAPVADPERILPDGCTEIVFHLADPFDRDLAHRDALHVVPSGADGGTIARARRALGTRLIALGSALAIDEAPARRSLAR